MGKQQRGIELLSNSDTSELQGVYFQQLLTEEDEQHFINHLMFLSQKKKGNSRHKLSLAILREGAL